jgi:hypothetical protein
VVACTPWYGTTRDEEDGHIVFQVSRVFKRLEGLDKQSSRRGIIDFVTRSDNSVPNH